MPFGDGGGFLEFLLIKSRLYQLSLDKFSASAKLYKNVLVWGIWLPGYEEKVSKAVILGFLFYILKLGQNEEREVEVWRP